MDNAAAGVAAVITDLNMPRMDGYELIRRLRGDHLLSATPVLVISADTDPSTPGRVAQLGVSAYFAKPFSPAEVRRKLEQILDGRLNSLLWLGLALPASLSAQTTEIGQILERLDRVEKQNRDLSAQVDQLKTGTRGDAPPRRLPALQLPPRWKSGWRYPRTKTHKEQAQTKVETSQKFPITITRMALFNAFLNSRNAGGVEYPTAASPAYPRPRPATPPCARPSSGWNTMGRRPSLAEP